MMSPQLTFRPREGVLFGTAAGLAIRLPTVRTAAEVSRWTGHESAQGSAMKKLTVAQNSAVEVYEYPGFYAQRFDGDDKTHPSPRSRAVLVRRLGGTVRLHGAPACGHGRCIVILQNWDGLFQALKTARRLSMVVEL